MGKTIPGLRFHWQREQIEDWTDGRSLRGTAFDGISENGFKLAKIGYLGDATLPGDLQRMHLDLIQARNRLDQEVSGEDRLDTIVDECVQLGCGNVELAAGFSR